MLLCPVVLSVFAGFLLGQLLQDRKMAELPRAALLWLPAQQEDPRTPPPGHSSSLSLPLMGWVSSSAASSQTCLIVQPGYPVSEGQHFPRVRHVVLNSLSSFQGEDSVCGAGDFLESRVSAVARAEDGKSAQDRLQPGRSA